LSASQLQRRCGHCYTQTKYSVVCLSVGLSQWWALCTDPDAV